MLKSLLARLNKKTIMFQWLMSYFVLIVIFMFSTGISLGYFYNTFKQETLRTNKYIMNVAGEEFDNIYSAVRNTIRAVTDESFRRLIATELKETERKEHVYSLMQQDLRRIASGYKCFEQCFLYLEDYDVIISTSTVLDSKLYHSAYFSKTGIPYDEWLKIITSDSNNSFLAKGTDDNRKYMLISKNAFSIIYREYNISLGFTLENSAIEEMNERIYDTSGAYILMADSKDNLLNFSYEDSLDSVDLKTIYTKDNVKYIKSDNGEYVLEQGEIAEGNTLMLVTPKKVFYNKLINILLIQICVLFLIIILMAILAVVFSKMHLSPVNEMLRVLNARKTDEGENEYKVISDIISKFQVERKNMDMRLSRQEEHLKNNFIRSLLRGEKYSPDSYKENLNNHKIDFPFERYMVLIFEITDYDEIWTGYSKKEADLETLRFALHNIVNELMNQKYNCCSVNMIDGIACILNLPSGISEKDIKKELSEIYSDIKKHMFDKLGFSFSMVGGGIKNTLEEISTSYSEAVSCLEYNLVYDKKIMFIDDSETRSSKELNVFFGKTARLVKLIRQGSGEDIEPAVEEWSRLYVSLVAIFPNVMQCELSGLINNIIREIFSLNYDEGETKTFAEQLTRKYKPAVLGSYSEIKSELLSLAADIKDFVEGKGNMDYLEKRIMDYIESNYTDPELNVTRIAEHFKLNPTYLSSAFKKTANVGILERINKFRCQKSTVLLSDTNHTVNDIAEMVGYSSVHTYIRIFKKYYFSTPTQYRTEIRRG